MLPVSTRVVLLDGAVTDRQTDGQTDRHHRVIIMLPVSTRVILLDGAETDRQTDRQTDITGQ